MNKRPSLPGRFGLDTPSFTMSARVVDGEITEIHSQDPRHNEGKLYSHFDSPTRQLHPGVATIATHEDVRTVFEAFEPGEHGLAWYTINRDDRMNKEAPARACSLKVQVCMEKLISGRAADERLSQPAPQMAGSLMYMRLISRYLLIFFGKTLTNEQRIRHAGRVVGTLRRWRAYIRRGRHALNLTDHFLPVQTYRHVILSCHSAALKLAAHAERGSTYELDLSRSGSNECENAFSGFGGFGKVLSNTRNFTFGQALEAMGDHTTLELYKYLNVADPLRFGSRMHKADIDISLHEPNGPEPSTADHPADWRTAYAAAWAAGDAESADECAALGMKPAGAPPDWWLRPWEEEEEDLRQMRTATADELGDEVVADGVDEAGELTGEQSVLRPDASHASVSAHDADAVINGAASAAEPGEREPCAATEGEAADADAGDAEMAPPPPAPQIFADGGGRAPTTEQQQQPTVLNVDPDDSVDTATAQCLVTIFERAQDAADEQVYVEGEGWVAAEVTEPSSTPTRTRRMRATLSLPADEGGGFAYKRTIVAELNKLRPGQHRLSTDRLAKVRQAAKMMADSREQPTVATGSGEADTKPGSTDAAEAPSQATDYDMLRVGSDFGMAFKECEGRAVRWVYWLGRVRLLYKKQRRSRVEVRRPLEVDELFDGGYQVVAAWYSRTPQRGSFKFNVVGDPKPYDLSHFIGLVCLDLDEKTGRYELRNKEQQLAALAAATRRTEPSKTGGGKRTVGEQEEAAAAQRARENAPHLQAEGEGAEKQQEREQRAAERAQARAAAQAAAGAPPKQGSPAWLDAFFTNSRCTATGGGEASGGAEQPATAGDAATAAAAAGEGEAVPVEVAMAEAEAEAAALEAEAVEASAAPADPADDADVQPSPGTHSRSLRHPLSCLTRCATSPAMR
jgi:hypothetical protein